MKEIQVPILLIGFNRPQYIRKIINRLSEIKPQKLYVSIDGARKDKPNDKILIEEVKSIVQNINWTCEVHYLFHEKNVGAEVNVSNAISWVLKNEEYVIVNEDDILAPYSFYRFIQDMLIKYKDDERIAMVSGNNFTENYKMKQGDYCFAKYGHIHGWGTWKRIWEKYDLNEDIKEEFLNIDFLRINTANEELAYRSQKTYQLIKTNKAYQTWDYMFSYFRMKNGLLSIIPQKHLTCNIGIYGLHHNEFNYTFHMKETDESFIATKHPQNVIWDKSYDIYHYKHYINPSWLQKKYNRLKSHLLSLFKYNKSYIQSFLSE